MSHQVEPARTWAVIAGVDRYGDASIPALQHQSGHACRFAQWLIDRGVPPSQIFLFLSPLPATNDLGVKLRDAWLNTVEEVLNQNLRTADASKELLLLYWGGHGIIAGDERALLAADATAGNLRCLSLNSLLFSLRTEHFPFAHQAVIVDSCAHHFPNEREANPLRFPQKNLLGDKRQFVLYSAADAEVATDGLFSPIALDWLERQEKTSWPPDLEDLATHVKAVFRQLRVEGRAWQTPVLFSHKPWDGDEQQLAQDYRMLRLLHETRKQLRAADGFTSGYWDECYRRTFLGAKLEIPPAASPDHAIHNLARQVSPNRIELLLEFALRIAERCENRLLETWAKQQVDYPMKFTDAKNRLEAEKFQAQQALENLAYLMVEALGKENALLLNCWLQPEGGQPIEVGTKDCDASLESLSEAITGWIDALGDHPEYNGSPLFIELFAPLSLLAKDTDGFDILGVENPFVMRVQERLRQHSPLAPRKQWLNVAERLRDLLERNEAHGVFWTPDDESDPVSLGAYCHRDFNHRLLGVSVSVATDENAGALLRHAVKGGIPYALWPRRPVAGEFKPPFDRAAREVHPWDQMPERLRTMRIEARKLPDHAAAAVTLLWDDPRRTPPRTISIATIDGS